MNIVRLPTARVMTAVFQIVTLGNIYAPSGAGETEEREQFFSSDLPYLLQGIPISLLVGGEFGRVLTNQNYSRTLQELIRGFDLVDLWETSHGHATYTHYTSRGASRIDRIYAYRNPSDQKRGVETRITAFTDHLAVVLRMALDIAPMRRGHNYWKMNTTLLRDKSFQGQLRQYWADWTKQIKHYPTMVLWWERVTKVHIKGLFIREGTERRREET